MQHFWLTKMRLKISCAKWHLFCPGWGWGMELSVDWFQHINIAVTSLMYLSQWGLVAHALRWRHYDHDSISNHQPHGCLFNRLFRRRSKKTSKLRVTGLCVGNSPGMVNSPHKGPVTRKMFPFDDVIMAQWTGSSLFRLMACWPFGTKSMSEPMLIYCQLNPRNSNIFVNLQTAFKRR